MHRRQRMAITLMCAAGAALAAATAAPAAVRTPSSGWEWGNPTPQGTTLRALDFAGARGFAVGEFGTILRTDDAGATWTGLPSGVSAPLTLVQAISPTSFVAGGGCVVRRSDDGGTAFRRLFFVAPSCREPVSALAFPSSAVGYLALADGTLVRTTDAGASFARRTAVPGTRSSAQAGAAAPTDLAFLGDTVGLVATSAGQIHRTIDAGGSWTAVLDARRAVRDITFVDALRGFAVGDGSLLLRTVDGGATWEPRAIGAPAPVDLASIRCVAGATPEAPVSCLAAARKGDVLVRTTDGGATSSVLTPSTDPLFAAAYASPTRVVAGGANGATVTSDDAGATFARVGSRIPGRFTRLRSTGAAAFAAGDDGALARTTDGGATWSRIDVTTSEALSDVSFPSAAVGYALDSAGALFRTADAGAGWSTLDTGTTARPAAMYAPTEQRVLLFGPTGIRRSNDGGGDFAGVRGRAVARTRLSGYDRAGSALFAWGQTALIRSTDGGATWATVRDPGRPRGGRRRTALARIRFADFVTARTGYVQDDAGRVFRTADGGRSWTELLGIGIANATAMAFSSARSGYLAHFAFGGRPGGYVLRTDDDGRTWAPQLVAAQPIVPGGLAAGGGVDHLLAGGSAFLSTRSGGRFGDPSRLSIRASRSRLRRPATIRITGRLAPARGNEEVVVSARINGRWRPQTARAASSGSFTTSWRVPRGTSRFVAQWAGDDRLAGRGTPVLSVRVGR